MRLGIVCTLVCFGVGAAAAESRPTAPTCPKVIERDAALGHAISTRHASVVSAAEYKHLHFVPGNHRPFAERFFIAPAAAVDRVVAIEAHNPRVIPEPFRAQLAERPRDAALRLEIAACEAESESTRRRATYDAALALLLGAPPAEASELIESATTEHEDPLSKDELNIEDALSRALLRHIATRRGPALVGKAGEAWLYHRVHRCGPAVCEPTMYDDDKSKRLVEWDLRDGGYVEEVDLPPDQQRARDSCIRHTHYVSRESCDEECVLQADLHTTRLDVCQLRCETFCK